MSPQQQQLAVSVGKLHRPRVSLSFASDDDVENDDDEDEDEDCLIDPGDSEYAVGGSEDMSGVKKRKTKMSSSIEVTTLQGDHSQV